jgi:NAD(P)-dependent dehydrogenase (short-subunit alcohol dehydrogenase family)
MSLVAILKGKGENGFGYGSTAEEVTAGRDLSGQTMLLTGCNAGLGKETLRVLALRGAHVLATARTAAKASAAIEAAGATGRATALACELSEPASVRACVASVRELGRPLAAIICNAGIMALPRLQQKLGYELQFLTNHVGHFILVTGLVDQLAEDGRVVMLSSDAHRRAPAEGIQFDNLSGAVGYRPWTAYGQSKLANLLFAAELARRLAGSGKTAYSVHPGVINTELVRHLPSVVRGAMSAAAPLVLKSIPQGAATQCYVATHPSAQAHSGSYFADCNPARPSRHGRDAELAVRLWSESEKIAAQLT